MGTGAIFSRACWKQKLVTRSSTESEVVGVHDVLPHVLWTKHFLEAQGFVVGENIVYQDNMSSILLEKNGRKSSTKRTKHMHIRYFYITDHVKNGTIWIDYCPTHDMVADFFTKPLQGSLFYKLRNIIMGMDPQLDSTTEPRSVLERKLEHSEARSDSEAKADESGTNPHIVHFKDSKSSGLDSEDRDDQMEPSKTRDDQEELTTTTRSNTDSEKGRGKPVITRPSYRDILIGKSGSSKKVRLESNEQNVLTL